MTRSANSGYSIIEVVVAIGILAVISVAAVNLFLRTSVGSGKDNTSRQLKQNGDFVISQFETSMRGAIKLLEPQLDCIDDTSQIRILTVGDETEDWTFKDDTLDNPNVIRLNGDSLFDSSLTLSNVLVNCSVDEMTNVTHLTLEFTLEKGDVNVDRIQDRGSISFQTGVTLRNR